MAERRCRHWPAHVFKRAAERSPADERRARVVAIDAPHVDAARRTPRFRTCCRQTNCSRGASRGQWWWASTRGRCWSTTALSRFPTLPGTHPTGVPLVALSARGASVSVADRRAGLAWITSDGRRADGPWSDRLVPVSLAADGVTLLATSTQGGESDFRLVDLSRGTEQRLDARPMPPGSLRAFTRVGEQSGLDLTVERASRARRTRRDTGRRDRAGAVTRRDVDGVAVKRVWAVADRARTGGRPDSPPGWSPAEPRRRGLETAARCGSSTATRSWQASSTGPPRRASLPGWWLKASRAFSAPRPTAACWS